ncbi:MAG: radical SAM protein [Thermoprotei archaeon]|nr:MAG: radical SAM protein [Thermoprotei archaeon]
MSYQVIKPFDPWRSPLCTCPIKWSLNPYTGCGHRCIYCYVTSYVPKHYVPRVKSNLIRRILKDLRKIPRGAIISISNSSDPYTPPESKLEITREILKILLKSGLKIQLITKSDLILRDLDILSKGIGRVVVAITITTLNKRLAKLIEPYAPPPLHRLKAIKLLSKKGIPVIARIDPIIPYINSDSDSIEELVAEVAKAGVVQVTSSTYKAKYDNLSRIKKIFPYLAEKFDYIYKEKGMRVHGYMYLSRDHREKLLKVVKEAAEKWGLVFETCREGLTHLNTPGFHCDGSTFFFTPCNID